MIGEHATSVRYGVVFDKRKLSIFDRHFKEAGILYKVEDLPFSSEIITWYVYIQNMHQAGYIAEVARTANEEAMKTNPN